MQTALSFRTNRDLFSNHYLDEHLPETEAWRAVEEDELREAREEILDLWNDEKETAPDRNESQLEEKFIRPMFRELGIPFEVEESVERGARRPDYGFFESREAATEAFKRRGEGEGFYEHAVAVADAKRWGRPLDTRGDHRHDFKNPSYQIHVYLQDTPTRWAVLTNGQKWRLYYGPTSHKLDSYYEIDLPTVLESDDLDAFRYFYLFFRHEAFLEDAGGDCFLDDVYEESNVFAQELGEDLQDNIYEAIKVLSEGFLDYGDNDLSEERLVDDGLLPSEPDDFERARLGLIHDSALIYLYRLIFVLYAEAEGRELLDTDNDIYEDRYSLNSLKQEVAEELDSSDSKYRDWNDDLWSRLDELFKLIDRGSKSRDIPEDDLYIPAYNGGLFRTAPDEDDSREARFLEGYEVGDAHLARVVELLTRSRNGNGSGKIFVDYSSLDIRHLGSVYEGLLEYKLNVADEPLTLEEGEFVPAEEGDEVVVEEGEVYLTTDSGERKATGSYYTPEYVVEYIVENTLGPLVDEIREDLLETSDSGASAFATAFAERVFELKVLDPAMGSGHFLTNAVDYLAREIIEAQDQQAEREGLETVDQSQDIYWARRQVAQRCVYGVDLNPLAVELSKVSLWLRTLAAEQPLAFLDHHLKTGNSLVGSDIEDVLENGEDDADEGQLTLQASFDRTRREALEHVTERFQELLAIDNETLADVKEMEEVFDEVRDDPLYQHLLAMANVHTADAFGLDVPGDAYERMAAALRDDSWDEIEDQDWFRSAQAMAAEERFFHWELEFPVAFYGDDGVRDEDAGFDAVIGNPPYVRMEQIKPLKPYLSSRYSVHDSRVDLFAYFIERSIELTASKYGVIVSNKWMRAKYGEKLRHLLTDYQVEQILDFGDLEVFPGISTYPAILIVDATRSFTQEVSVAQFDSLTFESLPTRSREIAVSLPPDHFGSDQWSMGSIDEERAKRTLDDRSMELSEYVIEVLGVDNTVDGLGRGVVTGGNDAFIIDSATRDELISKDERSREIIKPLLKGTDLGRYHIEDRSRYLIYAKEGIDIDDYSAVKSHLAKFKDRIGNTATDEEWFELQQDQEEYEEYFERSKICYPDISKECSFAMDERGYYLVNTCYFVPSDSYALLGVLNSTPVNWYYQFVTSEYRGGYQRSFTHAIKGLPVPLELRGQSDSRFQRVAELAEVATDTRAERSALNLSLRDYIEPFDPNSALSDLSGYQPAKGVAGTALAETTESKDNLRIGSVVSEKGPAGVVVKATARYKPENEEKHETDRWGYTETDYLEAFTLTDLTETEAALIEAFVPVAVEEGDGFAGFRDNATKTTSLLDRLKAITLPDPDDVEDDLRRYLETKERAEELDEKIEKTDRLIDEIVYELYGLTEEEIEIVEKAVGG